MTPTAAKFSKPSGSPNKLTETHCAIFSGFSKISLALRVLLVYCSFMAEIDIQDLQVILDAECHHLIGSGKWYIAKNGYVCRSEYLGKIGSKYVNQTVYLHRLIMNQPEGMQVDHINGNKLDNRKQNLRICSNQQNNRNTKSRKGSTSKFKGVSWDNTNKKWMSQISLGGGKHVRMGRFVNEIDAAKAYDEKAKIYHGQFAYLNFPD